MSKTLSKNKSHQGQGGGGEPNTTHGTPDKASTIESVPTQQEERPETLADSGTSVAP